MDREELEQLLTKVSELLSQKEQAGITDHLYESALAFETSLIATLDFEGC